MISTRWRAFGAVVAAVLAIIESVCLTIASEAPTKPDPDSPALVARGKLIYDQHCASCHGANLEGQPNWRHRQPNGRLPAPPHDASGHTWHHPDKDLFDMIKNGMPEVIPDYKTDMPAYKDTLTDADIWTVLSFIESTWPADIRARQQRMNRGNQ